MIVRTWLTRRQPRHVGASLALQRRRVHVFGAADPAVAWAGVFGLVGCESAVAAAVEEVQAGAEVDAVAEGVEVGFC